MEGKLLFFFNHTEIHCTSVHYWWSLSSFKSVGNDNQWILSWFFLLVCVHYTEQTNRGMESMGVTAMPVQSGKWGSSSLTVSVIPYTFSFHVLSICCKLWCKHVCSFFSTGVVEPIAVGQAARDYLARAVNPTLLKGLTQLCKKKPKDPVVSSSSVWRASVLDLRMMAEPLFQLTHAAMLFVCVLDLHSHHSLHNATHHLEVLVFFSHVLKILLVVFLCKALHWHECHTIFW